ncbi:MAG: cysteine desulfurase family protein [Clostridia bacterium]
MINNIYLDNAASTFIYDEVTAYVNEINTNIYGNASSIHSEGVKAYEEIKKCKISFASLLHTKPANIVFTSGGAESNNFTVKSTLSANKGWGNNLVITGYEHATILNSAKHMEKSGFEVRYMPLNNDGTCDISSLASLVDNKTILVSTVYVNSEIGSVMDIKKVSDIVKNLNPRCYYHVDAVQALGKTDINLSHLSNVDMMSFSSHKIHGPKGAGALYIKPSVNIDPLIIGSDSAGLRAGTLNTSGICGFCRAYEIMYSKMHVNCTHVSEVNHYLRRRLADEFSDICILSPIDANPYILNTAFKGIRSEVLVNALSERGIYVSSQSACSSKAKVSHVLSNMHVAREYIEGPIRVSFSEINTKEEIDIFLQSVKELLPVLKSFTRR